MTSTSAARAAGPIELALLEAYYATGESSSDTSSHWRALNQEFEVRLEASGELRAIGAGFGNCHWHSPMHRLFDVATQALHLRQARDRDRLKAVASLARTVAVSAGLDPTFDVFRQACTAVALESAVTDRLVPQRFLLIGDGYGILGGVLKRLFPDAQVVYVDLGRTLLFQAHHMRRAYSDHTHALIDGADSWPGTDFVYCPSDRVNALAGIACDVAVNVASMQEMAPEVVSGYFNLLRRVLSRNNLFYCCNREEKVMPGGEVSRFEEYPWLPTDDVLVDEPCPWHQYYLSPKSVDSSGRWPLPFVQRYDGSHRHRLVVMDSQS